MHLLAYRQFRKAVDAKLGSYSNYKANHCLSIPIMSMFKNRTTLIGFFVLRDLVLNQSLSEFSACDVKLSVG